MKKMIFSFIAVFAIAVVLVSWKNASTAGGGVGRFAEGCDVFDGSGGIVLLDPSTSQVTPSGNAKITCQGTVSNTTGKAVKFNYANTGIECLIVTGDSPLTVAFTQDWQNTVSASGQSTLQCHFNANK